MPNWCDNAVIIEASAEVLEDIARSVVTPADGDPALRDEPFSLAALIPQPATVREGWHGWRNVWWSTKWEVSDVEVLDLGDGRLGYGFSSAWGPPLRPVIALSLRWPTARVTLDFYEGGNDVDGYLVFENGRMVEAVDRERTWPLLEDAEDEDERDWDAEPEVVETAQDLDELCDGVEQFLDPIFSGQAPTPEILSQALRRLGTEGFAATGHLLLERLDEDQLIELASQATVDGWPASLLLHLRHRGTEAQKRAATRLMAVQPLLAPTDLIRSLGGTFQMPGDAQEREPLRLSAEQLKRLATDDGRLAQTVLALADGWEGAASQLLEIARVLAASPDGLDEAS